MATRKQVTITQVAREANVSTQTVSRVINDRPDVAPDTRRRVQEVVDRLGYHPNVLARSLIHQRSLTLGVVAMPGEYFGPSRTLVGIEKKIREMGYSLLLDILHHPEIENVESILNRLLPHQVDGIIWAVPEIGNNRAWIHHHRTNLPAPIIFLSMEPWDELASVSIDNCYGARLATEHLLAQGYRQIGILTGPLTWWEARQRYKGWKDALKAAKLPAEPRQVFEGNWSAESGAIGLVRLLEQFPEIEAVFISNDQMALGALMTAHHEKRGVPQDLGIVGFDNIPEAAFFWPPLTTVDQPLVDLGGTAVKELIGIIESDQDETPPTKPNALWLPPRLVIRQSSGRNAR